MLVKLTGGHSAVWVTHVMKAYVYGLGGEDRPLHVTNIFRVKVSA